MSPRNLLRGARRRASGLLRALGDLLLARFYCPVCSRRVRAFHPLPADYAEALRRHGAAFSPSDAETLNVDAYTCPHCAAQDRERLYALYFDEFLAGQLRDAPTRIAEFAPSVPLSEFIRMRLYARGAPFSFRTADLFMPGVDDRVDLMDLSVYPDASVDFLLCSHLLEHVADDRRALAELRRILRPGGQAIVMVPILLTVDRIDEDPSVVDEGERWKRFGQGDHVRLYSKAGFLERTREAGFSVRELGASHFGPSVFHRCGITPGSILYVGTKG